MTTIHNTVQSLDNMCNLMLIVIFQVEKYIREDQSSNQIIGYVVNINIVKDQILKNECSV